MDIADALNNLYYSMTLSELYWMNHTTLCPNISYKSQLYLDLIAYKENCTVSYLASALHISKPAVTIKVNELISQGLVMKTQSTADRRVFYLTITPEVMADYKRCDLKFERAVKKIQNNYTDQEIEMFIGMLHSLYSCYMDEESGKS